MANRWILALTVLCGVFSSALAFQPVAWKPLGKSNASPTQLSASEENSNMGSPRREFLQSIAASSLAVASVVIPLGPDPLSSNVAMAAETSKVLVLGGTGFVGSRVVTKLKGMGIDVVSTSRDGRDGTVALDVTTPGLDVTAKVAELAKGCSAVISTIGAIGTPDDETVNAATGLAAQGAKKAGVERFVYISVAPEVKEFAKDIAFLKPYLKGKTFSQDAITSNFAAGSTLIEPTFIQGGDEFKLNPPRVAGFYGEFIESLLSSGPIRAITNVAPEGFIKIALEPPVGVDSVASAAVAGALGKASPVLDTYDKINEAAKSI